VGGNEKEAILIESLNASEDVLEGEFGYLGDVEFGLRDLEVILGDGVDLVLGWLGR
jgi:hypothetical protein